MSGVVGAVALIVMVKANNTIVSLIALNVLTVWGFIKIMGGYH